MRDEASPGRDGVRTAEVIGVLSLATDLRVGLPLEHGLDSTLVAMRLAERLGVDEHTASQTYYACLLFYVGCTADSEVVAEVFEDDIHEHLTPVIFGSRAAQVGALVRAVAPPGRPPVARAAALARRLPRALRSHPRHLTAICEVARMLTDRLGLPTDVSELFAVLTERWDGKGIPGRARGDELPLAVRIVHVARDAAFHHMAGGREAAVRVVAERAGHAFDPAIADALVSAADEILDGDQAGSAWDRMLAAEPGPPRALAGDAIGRALHAMGDFADLVSPYLTGHSAAVAELGGAAAEHLPAGAVDAATARWAGFVHDLGRVAVPSAIWQKPGALTADEWEQVRLHAYHGERVLARSPFLAAVAPVATADHERLDGSGYHRGLPAAALGPPARLLAAADAWCAMTEPRPHRPALDADAAAAALGAEVEAGRLDADAVGAVLEAAGQRVPPLRRPAGLSEREAQVVALLARGLQTKEVARALGISAKTADRHVQNAYAKIGVSTRAAVTLFAMEHGLTAWGELPIATGARRA